MEDRVQEEKSKVTAAEGRTSKLQAKFRELTEKNRALGDENTQLRQILQQLHVRIILRYKRVGDLDHQSVVSEIRFPTNSVQKVSASFWFKCCSLCGVVESMCAFRR